MRQQWRPVQQGMKQLDVFLLFAALLLVCSGCGIPDLPGPIGIPGL